MEWGSPGHEGRVVVGAISGRGSRSELGNSRAGNVVLLAAHLSAAEGFSDLARALLAG